MKTEKEKMTIDQIKKGLSDRNLAEVARRLSVTRSYLQAIRSGKVEPSMGMINRLSEYLSCN